MKIEILCKVMLDGKAKDIFTLDPHIPNYTLIVNNLRLKTESVFVSSEEKT